MHRRPMACLALVAAAVTLTASACLGSHGADGATGSGTVVVTSTTTVAPPPDGPTSNESPVATATVTTPPQPDRATSEQSSPVMAELLSWIASAKAELAQYQLGLHVACAYSDARQCRRASRFSATIGSWIAADLSRVSARPAGVAPLWSRTYRTALALQGVAGRWCSPGRDLNGCASAVGAAVDMMSRDLSGWDAYSAVP